MPFDGMVLAAITGELNRNLIGCRIEKIYQPSREEVHLLLSRTGARYRLLMSADPGSARVHLTGKSPENPPAPPVFCMVLRKHLEGGRIAGFSQPGYDRVLTMSVDARDELGRSSSRQLICEIMGKHSNIILLDPGSGIIQDGIKRYTHAVSRHREVLPGRPYIPPPPSRKINPISLGDEEFFGLILENDLDSRVAEIIQRRFDGLSPIMAREIVHRAGLSQDTVLNRCGEIELTSVYRVLRDMYSAAGKGDFSPTAAFAGGTAREFSAFDLTHLDHCEKNYGGMNEVTDLFYSHRSREDMVNRLRQSIMSVAGKEIARLKKKLSIQTGEYEASLEAESLRTAGELLTANIHRLKRGDAEVYLDNFYKEGSPPERIIVNPRLTPAENAQSYFKRYNKAKKAGEASSLNLQKTREELEYLYSVENSADLASTPEEMRQVREEMIDQGYLKPAGTTRQATKKEKEAPRPAAFVSSQGFTILAGRNNRQNDYLTMKLSRPDDIWLHAREIPGSHVVIKAGGRIVPDRTLEEAASLAALFSRARQSGKVPVDCTLRKYVSKPKGAKPGFVIYTDQKTIIAEPDESLPERLAPPEED